MKYEDRSPEYLEMKEKEMLANLKLHHETAARILVYALSTAYEDGVYRYYHCSFKVQSLQSMLNDIVKLLKDIAPKDCPFCCLFQKILDDCDKVEYSDPFVLNNDFIKARLDGDEERVSEIRKEHDPRPLVEAFFHAKYFLEMVVKYAELEEPPRPMPFGYAALLELYGIR